jgi:3-hydroxyacyl-CoA dehydrogenase
VEVADAAIGKPFGFPKTGIFGLYDLIGNDLMPNLIRSLQHTLPATDAVQATPAEPPLLADMLARGLTGRKGGGGFYRRSKDRKSSETLDLVSGEFRPTAAPVCESLVEAKGDARALLAHPAAVVAMPGRCCRARSLMPLRWCPKLPTAPIWWMRPCAWVMAGNTAL